MDHGNLLFNFKMYIFIKTLCYISNNSVHRTSQLVCTVRIIYRVVIMLTMFYD